MAAGSVLRVPAWTNGPLRTDHLPLPPPTLVAVTSALHDEDGVAFERLVFQFDGQLPGYHVRYVPEVLAPGEGAAVPLRGEACIEITFYPAASHDNAGSSTLITPSDGDGPSGLVQYRLAGDFEGYVHYGLGVASHVEFRLTELAGPSRIAVDIAA